MALQRSTVIALFTMASIVTACTILFLYLNGGDPTYQPFKLLSEKKKATAIQPILHPTNNTTVPTLSPTEAPAIKQYDLFSIIDPDEVPSDIINIDVINTNLINTSMDKYCWSNNNITTINQLINNEEVCYEWEYYEKHMDTFNISFYNKLSSKFYCNLTSVKVSCSQLPSSYITSFDIFRINSYIVCDIESYDESANKCINGGANFKFYLQHKQKRDTDYKPYYIEGNIIDLFNGHYVGIIHTGHIILGKRSIVEYNLIIELDFIGHDASFGCRVATGPDGRHLVSNVHKIMLNKIYTKLVHIVKSDDVSSLNTMNLNDYLAINYNITNNHFQYLQDLSMGHWSKRNYQYEFIKYNKWGGNLGLYSMERYLMDKLFNTSKWLNNKWIHFMGKSRMYNFVDVFIGLIKSTYNYSTENHKLIKDRFGNPPRHDDFFYGDVYYFIEVNLLISVQGHDFGYRFYNYTHAYWNVTSYFINIRKHMQNINISKYIANINHKLPNILIFNKGLHQATMMRTKNDLIKYKMEINSYIYYYIQRWNKLKKLYKMDNDIDSFYFDKLFIFYKQTTDTHWPDKGLSGSWRCRTSLKINCLNRLTDAVITKYTHINCDHHDDIITTILDEYSVSLGRPDCTHDNRHYKYHNCKRTFVINMLYKMWQTFYHY